MTDFLSRLRAETQELRTRLEKLHAFMQTDGFAKLEPYMRGLLQEQKSAMDHYLSCLIRRLEVLDDPDNREMGEPVEIGGHDIDRDGPPAFSG